MLNIRYVKKDLITVTHGVIGHGVNCQGVMGSGVAKALRDKWPTIFPPYKAHCLEYKLTGRSNCLLGQVDFVHVGSDKTPLFVANMFTQEYYGKDGKRYAEPGAIQAALGLVGAFGWKWLTPVYLPRIGCGLGGLSWDNDVLPIVEIVAGIYPEIDFIICDV